METRTLGGRPLLKWFPVWRRHTHSMLTYAKGQEGPHGIWLKYIVFTWLTQIWLNMLKTMEKLETIEYFSCVVTVELAFFFTTNSSNSGPQSNMWESTFFIFNPLYKVTHPGKRRKWQLTEWKTQHNHPRILSTDSYRVSNVSGSLRVSETTFRCPWRQTISITVHDDALCLLRSLLPQLYSAAFQRLRPQEDIITLKLMACVLVHSCTLKIPVFYKFSFIDNTIKMDRYKPPEQKLFGDLSTF